MTTLEKAQFITNKDGLGLTIATLAKYADYHPSTVAHYINETRPGSDKLERAIERAIHQWRQDVIEKIKD